MARHRGREGAAEEPGGLIMARKARPRGVPFDDFLAENLEDPEFRRQFEQRRLVHEVALAIRSMREEAGMTQARLAALIGVRHGKLPSASSIVS